MFIIKEIMFSKKEGIRINSSRFLRKRSSVQTAQQKRIIVVKAVTKLAPPQQMANGREAKR